MQSKRVIIFIDGSNLYHGVKSVGISPRKLDYGKFICKIMAEEEGAQLQGARYYIGQVKRKMGERDYRNQQQFLASLAKIDGFSCHTGRVENRMATKTSMKLGQWLHRLVSQEELPLAQATTEMLRKIADKLIATKKGEKEVDAMIIVDMVSMAYEDAFDVAYLVSADTDFIPAIKKVRQLGKEVAVVYASNRTRLRQASDKHIHLTKEFVKDCEI